MSDRIDPPDRHPQRGPWPEVTDTTRLYDHGQPWCVNARAHPDANDGYPDPDRHLPWHECGSREAFVDDTRRDLDGEPIGLSVYLAAPFRFGQLRDAVKQQPPRVVVETWRPNSDETSQRLSLDAGNALRLARILVRYADELIFAGRVA